MSSLAQAACLLGFSEQSNLFRAPMATRSIAICTVALWACGGGISLEDYLGQKATSDTNALICELGIAPEYASVLAEAFQQEFPDLLLAPSKRERLKSAVGSGRAKYDGRKAKACLDQSPFRSPVNCWGASASVDLKLLRRAIDRPGPSDCTLIFTGTVADRGACDLDAECANQRCMRDTCPGKCAQTIPPGGPCRPHDFCPTDGFYFCGVCPAGTRCTPGGATLPTCQPPGLPRIAGASCFYDDQCQGGLFCVAGQCSTLLCPGASCNAADDRCGIDLYCNPTDPLKSTLGTCAARLDPGAACAEGAFQVTCALPFQFPSLAVLDCKGNQLCAGGLRDSLGHLVTRGQCAVPQGVGGPCVRPATGAPDPGSTGCYLGLVCDPATSKCARPPSAGQPCVDGLCDWGTAFCNSCGGTCQAKKADGAACQVSDECQASSACILGSCTPRSAVAFCAHL
jgi:hypothetical protein